MTKDIYSRREAAELLGVTIETVRKWTNKGLIKSDMEINGRPRYSRQALEAIIKTKEPQKEVSNG